MYAVSQGESGVKISTLKSYTWWSILQFMIHSFLITSCQRGKKNGNYDITGTATMCICGTLHKNKPV